MIGPKKLKTLALALALAGPMVIASRANAQPQMPDLHQMMGKPLPVADLPAGTVVVRVARQMPVNAVAAVDVTATTHSANGDGRAKVVKTGADGRATFEGLPSGTDFQAAVVVDGERIESARFPIPPRGGVRVMLISGLGKAPEGGAPAAVGGQAPEGAGGQAETFHMGAPTGTVEPAADLPRGMLDLELRDAADRPLVAKPVRLGEVRLKADKGGREVVVHDGVTGADGHVRYTDLNTGDDAGYAAVAEHEGMRISTVPFRMPPTSGMRGKIVALRRTSDPSVLSFDPRSKIIIALREDALEVMIGLFFRNSSHDIFDPGPEGLAIPLPSGAVNAQEIEGGEPLQVLPGKSVRLKTAIPPDSAASFASTARFGYILPSGGEGQMEWKQTLPATMTDPFILVPVKSGLSLSGPGLRALPDDTDGAGEKVHAYTLAAIPGGGAIALTVTGIPSRDRTGRNLAYALCAVLIVGAAIGATRSRKGAKGKQGPTRESLVERREKLFAELVEIEEQRKASAEGGGRLTERRREVIAKLEVVYRELAQLEESLPA